MALHTSTSSLGPEPTEFVLIQIQQPRHLCSVVHPSAVKLMFLFIYKKNWVSNVC